MKHKITFLFLLTGIIIYTLTVGINSISNIFLILIYIYLLSMLKLYEKRNTKNHNQNDLYNIIRNIPIPAFVKDLNHNILAANSEFLNLLNIKENTDYTIITNQLYSMFDTEEIKKEERKLYKQENSLDCERIVKTNSSITKYHIHKIAIFDNNKIKNIAVFIKNIEQNINNNSDNDNNKNIIATITHDLKTPAVAQIRAIELLLKGNFGEINETQRSFLNDILNSCNNMLDMLVNMLWLYKFDNKRVVVNISSFDVNDLIRDIFNENKLILNIKNSKFKQNNKTAKIHILADKMHIKRIISNILINAVNHSKENSTIFVETKIENDNFIFQVTNEGNYIPKELLECLFNKDKIFNQKCEGLSTGLGLYLSNSLLELNGGKFIYKSTPNGYNTFGFTINFYPQKIDKKTQNSLTEKLY